MGARVETVSLAHPKPTRSKPRKRSTPSLRAFYDFASRQPSCVSGERPVQLHHLDVPSLKSRQLIRKIGPARAAVVPLTRAEHEQLHTLGVDAFEARHGLPTGYLTGVALALLSAFITNGGE